MSASPRIRTTVVGSYPVPEWLLAAPSEQGLIDATRVVIATQEAAGVDVVCDGELYRFDLNHPETNGMIEYFVRPMSGIRYAMSFEEVMAYRAMPGMRFRTRPPGVVDSAIGSGTLDLVGACQRASALATKPFKFTVTGPHMLAKTLLDRHYRDTPELAHAIADVLAEQVRHLDADIVQLDNEATNWKLVTVLMRDKYSETVALGILDDARMAADYDIVKTYLGLEQPFDVKIAYTNEFLDRSIKMPK